jgi:hypothetical protein
MSYKRRSLFDYLSKERLDVEMYSPCAAIDNLEDRKSCVDKTDERKLHFNNTVKQLK